MRAGVVYKQGSLPNADPEWVQRGMHYVASHGPEYRVRTWVYEHQLLPVERESVIATPMQLSKGVGQCLGQLVNLALQGGNLPGWAVCLGYSVRQATSLNLRKQLRLSPFEAWVAELLVRCWELPEALQNTILVKP